VITETPESRSWVARHSHLFRTSGTYVIFIVICAAFSITAPHFASITNAKLVLEEIAPVVISGAAVTFVMVAGSLDLSVGGVLEISGLIAADLSAHGVPVGIAFLGGIAMGAVVGVINGLLVVKLGVNAVIATLGTWYAADGVANLLCNGDSITNVSGSFATLGTGTVGGVPWALVVMAAVVVVAVLLERRTLVGKYSVATGSNFQGARLAGIRVDRFRILLFIGSGAATGFAGILVASRLNSGQPTVGSGFEFEVIVAAILGGVSLSGGRGTVLGTCVGAAIVGVIGNALDIMNVETFWEEIIEGVILVVVVVIDIMLRTDGSRPAWVDQLLRPRSSAEALGVASPDGSVGQAVVDEGAKSTEGETVQ
jgi:ribose/xylose/arabinose/galactoside ABC-type transport system permease subunit